MLSMLGWLQQWTCLKARVVLCKFVCSNVYICAFILLFISMHVSNKKLCMINPIHYYTHDGSEQLRVLAASGMSERACMSRIWLNGHFLYSRMPYI